MSDKILYLPFTGGWAWTWWLPGVGTFYVLSRWLKKSPTDRDRVLTHERVHGAQIERHGAWFFYSRWFFSKHWRLRFEAEAYASNVRWFKARDQTMWRYFPAVTILDHYAETLAKRYVFHWTIDECRTAIARFLP